MREILSGVCTAVLVLCVFIVPATALAALLGGAFGSVAGPDGSWWGACVLGGFVATVLTAYFGLEALEHR